MSADGGRAPVGGVVAVVAIATAIAVTAALFFLAPRILPPEPTPSGSASPSASPSPSLPLGGGVPVDQSGGVPGDDADGSAVVPFVVRAEVSADGTRVDVYAFVPGITEDGGVCTAILSGDGPDHGSSAPAAVDVATTRCEPISIPLSGPAEAELSVVVRYESSTATGESERAEVTVG